jgi:hypothetical protein
MTIQQLLSRYPEIGVLSRNGKTIYYITRPHYREAHHPVELIDAI